MWLLKLGWITTVKFLNHSTKITVDHQGINSETEQTSQYHIANTTTNREKKKPETTELQLSSKVE